MVWGITKKLYPTIDKCGCSDNTNLKRYITLINPSHIKGLSIVLKIAKSMPNKEFLLVGGNIDPKLIKDLKNVTVRKWTDNITNVYQETRLLLVPSIWPEPFGRVVVEAGLHNIPSIVSNRGGLPEAIGKGGIVINQLMDITSWINAINYFDDKHIYDKYSLAARENANLYDFEITFNLFKSYVQSELKLAL